MLRSSHVQRLSSTAAGSRSEERAQAIGSRVQSLVLSYIESSDLVYTFCRLASEDANALIVQRFCLKKGDSLFIARPTPLPSYKSMCVAPSIMNSSFDPTALA